MMSYLQKMGRSLMLPVAVLPVASILMGIGYWISPAGLDASGSPVAAFLIQAGLVLIDNIPLLFAVGFGCWFGQRQERGSWTQRFGRLLDYHQTPI